MVKFAGDTSAGGVMTLLVDRIVHSQTWRYILTVPHEFWTDLFFPASAQWTALDAYRHDQPFWDHLAEWNADERSKKAMPESANRTSKVTLNNQEWLMDEYSRFKQTAKTP